MTATMDHLDDEVTTDPAETADAFTGLLGRLNDQSVRPGKHFDAYVDVPWDEHPIDPTDPRWELHALDGLGATAWYQAVLPNGSSPSSSQRGSEGSIGCSSHGTST